MRVLLLAVLAGCFEPSPKPGQSCTDWCPPPETCVAKVCRIVDEETRPNYMFVTSDARPIVEQSVTSLDQWCNERASAAKLPGTYVAWFSGQLSAASLFPSLKARGWIRPDGLPFADTVEDILAGKLYYPPRISDEGDDKQAREDVVVATGTGVNGMALETCNNLAPGSTSSFVTVGRADAGLQSWTHAGSEVCNLDAHIYCFAKDRTVPIAAPKIPPGGKRVFVTRNAYPINDPASADQLCRNEAGKPGFVAMLATAGQSVKERFADSTGPWYRSDGVVVTEDMTELTAPIELTFDGMHVRSEVWFGAPSLIEIAGVADSCTNWTSPGGSMRTGLSERSIRAAFSSQNGACNLQYRYYCAEL